MIQQLPTVSGCENEPKYQALCDAIIAHNSELELLNAEAALPIVWQKKSLSDIYQARWDLASRRVALATKAISVIQDKVAVAPLLIELAKVNVTAAQENLSQVTEQMSQQLSEIGASPMNDDRLPLPAAMKRTAFVVAQTEPVREAEAAFKKARSVLKTAQMAYALAREELVEAEQHLVSVIESYVPHAPTAANVARRQSGVLSLMR